MKKLVLLIAIAGAIVACSKDDESTGVTPTEIIKDTIPDDTIVIDTVVPFDCRDTTFAFVAPKGIVNWIDEASGLSASSKRKKSLYTHEDSNNQNKVYLFSSDNGSYQGSVMLVGAQNDDWEDMALSYGPTAGVHYLYVADIGDNKAKRTYKQIYRIPEPPVDTYIIPFDEHVTGAETIEFIYDDGKRDAECLLVDPLTKDLYIVTKREAKSQVYKIAYPQSTNSVNTAERIHTLDFREVTGGDVSLDGDYVVLKTYEKLFLWKRKTGESFETMIQREPYCMPYEAESQGEAIAFDFEALNLYTLSEKSDGVTPSLLQYKKQ